MVTGIFFGLKLVDKGVETSSWSSGNFSFMDGTERGRSGEPRTNGASVGPWGTEDGSGGPGVQLDSVLGVNLGGSWRVSNAWAGSGPGDFTDT